MSSKPKGCLIVDEKKMKRMISNRQSARKSRMKKEKLMKDLNDQIFYFTKSRDEMVSKIEGFAKGHAAMELENMVLRSKKQELEKRLEHAMTVSGWYGGDGVFKTKSSMEVVREPWEQPPVPPSNSMCVTSSAGFSQF